MSATTWKRYTDPEMWHPAARAFPLMTEPELKDLADDIKAKGCLQPVLLHEGLVLDGRNRILACALVDVQPRILQWQSNGMGPAEYVISANLKRRHLTSDQRAAAAAELKDRLANEAAHRQKVAEAHKAAGRRMQAVRHGRVPALTPQETKQRKAEVRKRTPLVRAAKALR